MNQTLARSRFKEGGAADMWVPPVSDSSEEKTLSCLTRPAHAGAGRRGSVRWPISEREQGRPTRAGLQAASSTAGKSFSFFICFQNHLNKSTNPIQIKNKNHTT
jgi:hypothetical protein